MGGGHAVTRPCNPLMRHFQVSKMIGDERRFSLICDKKMCGHHGHGANPDTLYGVMRRCGHILHHGDMDKEKVFDGLTEDEQAQLKTLLTKLLDSWKPVEKTEE